jgi:hypothetical protein
MVSCRQISLPIFRMHFSSPSWALHSCPSHSLLKQSNKISRRILVLVPYYAICSILLSLHNTYVKIFSSAPCSETPSICVLPLTWEIRFQSHVKTRKSSILCVSVLTFIGTRRKTKGRLFISGHLCEIAGCHDGEYEDGFRLGCSVTHRPDDGGSKHL